MSLPPPRICLINMPFASPEAPSIALTQLKAVLDDRFSGRIETEIHYLHLDFLDFTEGPELYQEFTSGHGRLAGTADWFFRQSAFPDAPDNTTAYLDRFFFDEETAPLREFLLENRSRLNAFLDSLIDRHRLHEAAIVGFTSLFFQTMASFAMARRLKGRNPDLVTVIGGAACEAEMGRAISRHVPQIDHVFSGPALVSFPTFIERHLSGDNTAGIPGLFSRNQADPIPTLGTDLPIDRNLPLDYTGFLDRFEESLPGGHPAPMLLFETSRGCSWGEKITCTFCGLNGLAMDHRAMSPEHAVGHIRNLFQHVPRCRFFLAVDTIVPKEYFDEVFPRLETPPGVAMMYEVRATLDAAQLRTLCDAGVHVVQPGIESLDTPTLKLMRKGTTAFVNLRFLKNCVGLPLHVEWNLLLGSPREPEDIFQRYLDLIPRLCHLPPPGGAFPISFDRFSPYFNTPGEHDLDLEPQEFYQFAYPLPPGAVRDIAYHFIDRNADHDLLNTRLEQLNTAITTWQDRFHDRDGLGPARLTIAPSPAGAVLRDNRDGHTKEIPLDPDTLAVLELLDTPKSVSSAEKHLGSPRFQEKIAQLRDWGVLFEENNRLLSLVTT